jgi:hypothetical protein
MTQEKFRIAIDKDDTLNWLTHEIMVRSGVSNPQPEDIPAFSEIKASATIIKQAIKDNVEITEDLIKDFPRVTLSFLQAREKCFSDPAFFKAKPYGLAHSIVDIAKSNGFEPVICTKTLSNHPLFAEVTAAKMEFWKEHFSDIDMMIATGVKCIDAIALIDDLDANCLAFNKTNFRPTLVWNHKTGTEDLLQDFYNHCNTYAAYLSLTSPNIKYSNLIFEKNGNKIRIVNETYGYLSDHKETITKGASLIESVYVEGNSCEVINLYFREVDSDEDMQDIDSLRYNENTLYSIIFNNFNI